MPTWAQIAASPPPRIDSRPPNKTGFLHLAQELQDQILEYALVRRGTTPICLGGWREHGVTSNTLLSLSAVSSKIRHDAIDIFASKNIFVMRFRDTSYDGEDDYGWYRYLKPPPKRPCCCPAILPRVKRIFVVPFHGQDKRGLFLDKNGGKWFVRSNRLEDTVDWDGRQLLRGLQSRKMIAPTPGLARDEFEFTKAKLWNLEQESNEADKADWRESRSHEWDW